MKNIPNFLQFFQGATALCIAAQEGHLECVRTLLEWGANPVHSDRCGRTPIRVAMKSGHVSISKLLEEIALARSKTCKLVCGRLTHSLYPTIFVC
jgi:ankyrin repeat protein